MTLDEAIKHCEDVAEDRCGCAEDCVNEHRQLAEWLKELKAYREADTPQTEDAYFCELMDAVERGEMSDASANQAYYEYINKQAEESDTPQTDEEYINSLPWTEKDCPWK